MRSINFNFIFYAIILTLSLYEVAFLNVVSAFAPSRNAASVPKVTATVLTTSLHNVSNGINYEPAGRKPTTATQGSNSDEEASQEDDDENEEEDGIDNNSGSNETNESEDDKNCTCSGSSCTCCINLNLSFIDLGGPGCVKFGYIAANDSIAVNMSYGGRLLESDTLKRTSLDPTCMDLFSDLAQMCAKFTGLTKVTKGVKGCISVEPWLLGVSQTSYDVGCFNMDVEGLQVQTPQITQYTSSTNSTKNTTDKQDENEEEELEAAISQSAVEGINWFNSFIASVFGEESNDTASSESVEPYNNRTNTNNVKLS